MIFEFSITNTYSIKEKQTISFEATGGAENNAAHCIEYGENKFLKLACLYGANASGKTKMAEAFDYYIAIMITSFARLRPTEDMHFVPFMFDEESRNAPGEFEIIFYAEDFEKKSSVIRYEYQLKINKTCVLEEALFYSPKGQRKLIFDRKKGQPVKWGADVTGAKKIIEGMTRDNCSLISAGAQAQHPIFFFIYNHFTARYIGLVNLSKNSFLPYIAQRMEEDLDFKNKVINLLSFSDFGNISEIKIKREEMPDSILARYPMEVQREIAMRGERPVNRKISFVHHYGSDCELPFFLESAGTQRIMELALPLVDITQRPSVCFIDELESSLHQELLEMFLQLFLECSSDSQMLFTTHNQELLDSGLLRDDEIWFCNRAADGSSKYSSISDYTGIRKEVSRKRLYKADKFGALPNIDINALRRLLCAEKN